MENISIILNYILGGTSIVALIGAIYYRKQNRTIKESEATQSNVEAQKAQMELADLYKQKMLEMMDLLNAKQDKGNVNQEKMISMLGNLDRRVDIIEEDVGNIKGYLDGDLAQWIAEHRKEEERKMKMKLVDEGEDDHE